MNRKDLITINPSINRFFFSIKSTQKSHKMKKIISYTLSQFLLISILLSLFLVLSCTQEKAQEPIYDSGGEILSGTNKGHNYRFGSEAAAKLALDFSTAFVNKNYAFLSKENFKDTMFFYPEKGLERLEFDIATAVEIIKSMHEPYDSITRSVYDVIPVVPSYDEGLTVVMFPFTETRYKKDGSEEKYHFFERHYIREGKITGVRKWSREE